MNEPNKTSEIENKFGEIVTDLDKSFLKLINDSADEKFMWSLYSKDKDGYIFN